MAYRVLIRAFSLRRDVIYSILIGRILERRGCEVRVASVRDFQRVARHWKPHAILLNTQGQISVAKRLAPEARILFLPGEPDNPPNNTYGDDLACDRSSFDQCDRVLLWGPGQVKEFESRFEAKDLDKVVVVGNPKLDLIKYMPDSLKATTQKPQIGIVGRYNNINPFDLRPILVFFVQSTKSQDMDHMLTAVHGLQATVDITREVLDRTSYRVSLRPYPTESFTSYEQIYQPHFGSRVEVDGSLCFPAWAVQQTALVGPSSTAFLDCYLLKKPIISIDRLAGIEKYRQQRSPMASRLQKASYMPETIDDLITLLDRPLQPPEPHPDVDSYLEDLNLWPRSHSAIRAIGEEVIRAIEERPLNLGRALPASVLDFWDEISFRRVMRKEKLHAHFNYKKGYHPIPAFVEEMADAIMAEEPALPTSSGAHV